MSQSNVGLERKGEHCRLEDLQFLCQPPCDAPLLLPTTLQLADVEHEEGRGPHQTSVHWTFPWTPAKTHRQQPPHCCFTPDPPVSILAWLTPDGAPKPPLPLLAHKMDKENRLQWALTIPQINHRAIWLQLSCTSLTQKPSAWHNCEQGLTFTWDHYPSQDTINHHLKNYRYYLFVISLYILHNQISKLIKLQLRPLEDKSMTVIIYDHCFIVKQITVRLSLRDLSCTNCMDPVTAMATQGLH